MLRTIRKAAVLVGSAVTASLVSLSAHAQFTPTPLDTADAVTQLGEISTGVAAIGGGLLIAAAVAVGFKWMKGALFG